MPDKQTKMWILEGVIATSTHYRQTVNCRFSRNVDDQHSRCRRCDAEDWLDELKKESS